MKNLVLIIFTVILLIGCGKDRAADANANTSVLGVEIVVPNAKDDTVKTGYETSILIDILVNDIIDKSSVLALISNAKNGVAELQNGKVLYTPKSGFIGLDRFSYSIVNSRDENDTAEVSVSIGIGVDSDDDGLSDEDEVERGTNPHKSDTDGDGLKDGEEVHIYETDPINQDTDFDGLKDGEEVQIHTTDPKKIDTDNDDLNDSAEVNIYPTDPKNPDTDNDGLKDGEEIKTYESNATNPDTDGDCLLDGFEVKYYKTNLKNIDTDGDKIDDGIEVYSYTPGTFIRTCLTQPETLAMGHNPTPAKDGIPNPQNDVINALDPSNDSDGDGQANSQENTCAEGDPSDPLKLCMFDINTTEGRALQEAGYTYIPGGFDVDGDGKIESGFWMSRYQARKSGALISSEDVISSVGNINKFISTKFKVLNRNIQTTSYDERILNETEVKAGEELLLKESDIAGKIRITKFTPYLAEVCLSKYQFKDEDGNVLDVNVSIPTHKQYVHVMMLLNADLNQTLVDSLGLQLGDGRHARNGLLAIDPSLPLSDYSVVIDEFGTNRDGEQTKEFLRNLIQLREHQSGATIFTAEDLKDEAYKWWLADYEKSKNRITFGSASGQDIGHGEGPSADIYGVISRARGVIDTRISVTGTESDGINGIGFRAATAYK